MSESQLIFNSHFNMCSLSTKKMKNETTASSMTPRRLHPSPQGTIEFNDECALSTPNDEDDPSNNNSATATNFKKYHHSAVKFGTNSAAEFDKLLPITEMTPMPTHLVQEIFPSDTKEEPAEEQQVSRETARNVATLAEWDDLFEDEDDIEQSTPQRKRGRRRTPYKSKNRKSSKSRRDSTIFSKERRSLLETSDDENMLPLSVTIDPMQYTSPSTIDVTERDSLNRDIIPEKSQINRDSLESTTSVCISPSSLASSERSMLGRETPNSARTSSSNILRAVHASGAELPSHSPEAIGGMRPNQLNYSPGSTALSVSTCFMAKHRLLILVDSLLTIFRQQMKDSSPLNSDNQSLGSDVMSSFSQHTIDSRNDADIFQHHLSILSNHPLQMLHLQIGDMLVMLQAGTKDFITFLDEDIFHSLTPSTYLALIKGQDDKKYLFPELFTSIASWNDLHNIESFQSILGNEIASACSDKFLFSSTEKIQLATSLIKEEQVIASCVKKCYDNAAFEWSNIELAMANEAAIKFEELVKQNKKDIEAKKQAPVKSKTKQLVQDEVSLIKSLEEELVGEINRLASFEREQQILRSNLELERYSPIVMLSEEIRSSIHRLEPFDAASGFNIPLLDRAAEVTIEIDGERIIEIGFSIKGEGISIQLLQALLLGQIDTATDISYPIPIRKSLSSRLMDNQCLKSAFRDAFTLLSRVDSLVACVKSLETEFMCTMSSEANGDVTIAFSAHQGGRVIKVGFVFESLLASTWHVATVPADVKVSIVSAENDQDNISESLQQKAYTILKSAGASDPILLKRVVFGVMSHVSEATGVQ